MGTIETKEDTQSDKLRNGSIARGGQSGGFVAFSRNWVE